MKFVFDLDGTLCFDGMTMSKDLQKVLLTAPTYFIDDTFNYAIQNSE